ncbi:MAG: 4-alpha-glucanotransferase [Actinomycetia bacterium]|nr:4-alpha-glucanotransferase [Actinomycetes bacterium]
MSSRVRALRALAKAYGVQRQWRASDGNRATVSDDTLLVLVRLLGAQLDDAAGAPDALRAFEAERAARVVEPVAVQWGDERVSLEVRMPAAARDADVQCTVELDDGTTRAWSVRGGDLSTEPSGGANVRRVRLPEALPIGVHTLRVDAARASAAATLLAAPARLPVGRKQWGVFVPMYALRPDDRPATGDLATFERFARWAGSLGAGVLGTLPLLATFFGAGQEPNDPSPYAPVTRRHWNEVYLDLSAVPEVEPGTTVEEPSPGEFVDLPALAARKRVVLEHAATRLEQRPARRDAFARFLEERPDVVAYAQFRAGVELGGPGPASPVRVGIEHPVVRYHAYAQWLVETQLEALAHGLRKRDQELYLDLPIGAHPDGFDVAAEADLFAHGASVGAPPDLFFSDGQCWGFPPVLPQVARATGHRYLRECIGAHLRMARWLRVDHVIGFHRMWWVPNGASPRDGAYVSYPAEEQYAVLAIGAARAGGHVVGENLGTVPPETNRALRRHGMLGMHVVQFELDPRAEPPLRPPGPRELTCLDTHDTATFAAFWRDLDAECRDVLLRTLREAGCLDATEGEPPAGDVLSGLLAYLGGTRAEVVLASLEDLWLETEPQNVPGTTPEQRPNFRRRAARSLADLESSTVERDILRRLDRARGRPRHAPGRGVRT